MFLFKNGCTFELNGVEITVPDNFYIDGSPDDLSEEWLTFMPLDKSFSVRYEMNYNCRGTKEELYDFQFDDVDPDKPLSPIEKIEHNGLTGHQLTYKNECWQSYKVRFLLDKTDEGSTEFAISVNTDNLDIDKIKASPIFKRLLDGIRKI